MGILCSRRNIKLTSFRLRLHFFELLRFWLYWYYFQPWIVLGHDLMHLPSVDVELTACVFSQWLSPVVVMFFGNILVSSLTGIIRDIPNL